MKTIDLRRLLDSQKALLPYLERKGRSDLPPHSVELHPTTMCNYNCYHCSYQQRRAAKQRLDDQLITPLVSDLCEMRPKGVYWSGGGEPTTISRLPEYIEAIADAGIEQALVTNAVLLSQKLLEQITRLNYVAVSFQASSRETYEKITGCDKRDKLFENVRLLRRHLDSTILGARSVINKLNFREIRQMLSDVKTLGFDYIIFIPVVDYEKGGEIELSQNEKQYLAREVAKLEDEIDDSYTNLRKVAERGFRHYGTSPECNYLCYANQIRATAFVNYDGGVWLCQPHIGIEKYCIGNINEQRFKELWNSARHEEVIELLDNEHKTGACRNCRSIAYNRVIHDFTQTGEGKKFYDPFL